MMNGHRKFLTASYLINTWCTDTATLKLLPCWQRHNTSTPPLLNCFSSCWKTHDALTPQLLNCFLVDKHDALIPFKQLFCWQRHDALTLQLLNCFLVDENMMLNTGTLKLLPCWQRNDNLSAQLWNCFCSFWQRHDALTPFKQLFCWQRHDAITPQLLNCFLVDKQDASIPLNNFFVDKNMMHRHRNF